MSNRLAYMISFGRVVLLTPVGLIMVIGIVALTQPNTGTARAQSISTTWESAGRGKHSFEVASVKQNQSTNVPTASFPLNNQDGFASTGGLFSATNYRLDALIGFAYRLTGRQTQFVLSQLPKWAVTERFDIQARADDDPTKDQMRLMLQSLLADRFKLVVHVETQQLPVFAVILVKPGKLGPEVHPHSDNPPCVLLAPPGMSNSVSAAQQPDANGLPAVCGVLQTRLASGRMHAAARNVTVGQFASYLPAAPISGLDRPVLDETGLTGNFDLTLEWTPEAPIALNGATVPLDETGPTFLEALREQLGVKLESKTGSVDSIVIDHVEEPSEN